MIPGVVSADVIGQRSAGVTDGMFLLITLQSVGIWGRGLAWGGGRSLSAIQIAGRVQYLRSCFCLWRCFFRSCYFFIRMAAPLAGPLVTSTEEYSGSITLSRLTIVSLTPGF